MDSLFPQSRNGSPLFRWGISFLLSSYVFVFFLFSVSVEVRISPSNFSPPPWVQNIHPPFLSSSFLKFAGGVLRLRAFLFGSRLSMLSYFLPQRGLLPGVFQELPSFLLSLGPLFTGQLLPFPRTEDSLFRRFSWAFLLDRIFPLSSIRCDSPFFTFTTRHMVIAAP